MIKNVVLDVARTTQFKRDYKKSNKQGKDLKILFNIIDTLRHQRTILAKYRDHALFNNWSQHRELHFIFPR